MADLSPITKAAAKATEAMHRANSDGALQCAIELMLTDRKTTDVVASLRAWADYLEERK